MLQNIMHGNAKTLKFSRNKTYSLQQSCVSWHTKKGPNLTHSSNSKSSIVFLVSLTQLIGIKMTIKFSILFFEMLFINILKKI